jgi:hypothetical protein
VTIWKPNIQFLIIYIQYVYPNKLTGSFDNRYVNLTDDEGARTRSAIPNIHGIVKFEINRVYTDNRQVFILTLKFKVLICNIAIFMKN